MRAPVDLALLDAVDDPLAVADAETVLDRERRVAALRRLAARYRREARDDRANRPDLLRAAAAADELAAGLARTLVARRPFDSLPNRNSPS